MHIQKEKKDVNNFKVKLVYYHTSPQDINASIGALDSYLSDQGYSVDQYNFTSYEGSSASKFLMSIFNGTSILNRSAYEYKTSNFGYIVERLILKKKTIFGKKFNKIIDEMNLEKYNLIGFSVHGKHQILTYLMLAKLIKERFDIPVVFGGPYIKLFHNLLDLKRFAFVDYLVISDGEIALLELIKYLEGRHGNIEKIPSLKYVHRGKVVTNKKAFLNINDAPLYNLSVKRLNETKKSYYSESYGLPYELSRGCPFSCSFCTWRVVNKYQKKDVNKVIRELKIITKKYNYNRFKFSDACFNSNHKYVEEFCDAVIKSELLIDWSALAIPNFKFRLLSKMKKAGCRALFYGVETGSPKINKLMGKPVPIEIARKCLHETKLAGIKNIVYVLVGHPYENKFEFYQTLNFMEENKNIIDGVFASKFQLEYGSIMYNDPKKSNIKIVGNCSSFNFDSLNFDEVYGLKWKEKDKQTKKHFKILVKTLKKLNITTHISR